MHRFIHYYLLLLAFISCNSISNEATEKREESPIPFTLIERTFEELDCEVITTVDTTEGQLQIRLAIPCKNDRDIFEYKEDSLFSYVPYWTTRFLDSTGKVLKLSEEVEIAYYYTYLDSTLSSLIFKWADTSVYSYNNKYKEQEDVPLWMFHNLPIGKQNIYCDVTLDIKKFHLGDYTTPISSKRTFYQKIQFELLIPKTYYSTFHIKSITVDDTLFKMYWDDEAWGLGNPKPDLRWQIEVNNAQRDDALITRDFKSPFNCQNQQHCIFNDSISFYHTEKDKIYFYVLDTDFAGHDLIDFDKIPLSTLQTFKEFKAFEEFPGINIMMKVDMKPLNSVNTI